MVRRLQENEGMRGRRVRKVVEGARRLTFAG
jgi:hypothetical protein